MRRKLQVFVSSTFTDLIPERQAAVAAILSAGHIPAGMELFNAGDKTQQEVIKRWIDESDAYMLILGGRYGSLMPDGDKSYTHWEYGYAQEIGKPSFALVLTKSAIQSKITSMDYQDFVQNVDKLDKFRNIVESKVVKHINNATEIESAILRSLKDIENEPGLAGWISAKNVSDVSFVTEEKLTISNQIYKQQRVIIDNKEFVNCVFLNCELILKGNGILGIVNCKFSDDCEFTFIDSAALTVDFLRHLYSEFGEGGRIRVESLINDIRRGGKVS
ncbi:DUF4062 domain-containing protein [Paenibacillus sp. sptzw28]|uniref:DUF4062 domain-containing protein n=1 Tax=Paenibacillus sp. sptzw28 TaxID=715179 RepID=UPI001C6EDDF2|nr:DUF4062 domain-containing protein [Paenibacillus sp. sptzw28]QYR21130.1 DUF4062 domain-containing protein [Paenibacillus sp. sptzw28]